ncbi:hypothetical protein C8R45DRAFT_1099741 [Mycena sanguinolenta]|nr:hypothetical protein C8R45DRAFT_1099741 [Mycena sanguinolenta]
MPRHESTRPPRDKDLALNLERMRTVPYYNSGQAPILALTQNTASKIVVSVGLKNAQILARIASFGNQFASRVTVVIHIDAYRVWLPIMDSLSALSVLALSLALLPVLYRKIISKSPVPFPTGPKGLPILGNALDMPTSPPWITF